MSAAEPTVMPAAARILAARAAQRGGATADNATLILLRADAATDRRASWFQQLAEGFASLFNRSRR